MSFSGISFDERQHHRIRRPTEPNVDFRSGKRERDLGSTERVLIFQDLSQSEDLINATLTAFETGLILTFTPFKGIG